MAKPGNISLTELEQRKRKLQAELKQIHQDFDESVSDVSQQVVSTILPREAIRRRPIKSVAIAVVAGFIVGLPKRSKRSKTGRIAPSNKHGITSLISDELKRYAARRAVTYLMNSIDDQLTGHFFPRKEKTNGES